MTQPKDWRFGKHIMAEDRVERRLAAILAADVAGYSRLMGADEEGTLAALKAHRRAVLDPKITEHRGRIVKTTGDGLLVEFASVVDAVRCAVDMQRQMAERNAGVAAEQRIEFRIGLNVGDISIDDKDIYGDGVNIAAHPAGSVSAVSCATRCATSSISLSRTWVSSKSRTSPGRCVLTAFGSILQLMNPAPRRLPQPDRHNRCRRNRPSRCFPSRI